MSNLRYFAISKLLLDGWREWFKILHGVTDRSGECQYQYSFTEIKFSKITPPSPKVSQSFNVVPIEKPLVYLRTPYLRDITTCAQLVFVI